MLWNGLTSTSGMQAKVEERNRCQPVRICAWGSGLFLRAPARHANQFALMLLCSYGTKVKGRTIGMVSAFKTDLNVIEAHPR